MLNPNGRVVMVSGASRGIGLAIARALHGKGYMVSASARDVAALDDSLADLEADRLLTARYEAGDRHTHQAWLDATIHRFGRLDALVNNAGISNRFQIESGDETDLDAVWTVNVKGPLFLTRICLPHLRVSGSGRIINLGSLSGKRVRNDNVAYNLSKIRDDGADAWNAPHRLGRWCAGHRALPQLRRDRYDRQCHQGVA